jgi:chaperonin cofactor prefoldin
MYSLEIKQMQHDMEKLALEVTTRHDLAQDLKKEVDHLRNQIKAELNEVINNATT